LYGEMGTWKTTWAAQWPGVVFLSIRAEGGDESLKVYPQIAQYLCNRSKMKDCPPVFSVGQPQVFEIKSCAGIQAQILKKNLAWHNCFHEAITQICLNAKAWGVCTVVVDSVTYLLDLWIEELMQQRDMGTGFKNKKWRDQIKERGGELMGPPEWGMLNMFLRAPRVALANAGLNVIWTALDKKITEQDPNNISVSTVKEIVPHIQGQTKVKLPAQCNLHIWAEKNLVMDPSMAGQMKVKPTYWTAPSPKVNMIRHRYGFAFPKGRLDDPEWGNEPTFRAVWNELSPYIYTGT